ncbi:unnamed protein product [Urochloa humidicola]
MAPSTSTVLFVAMALIALVQGAFCTPPPSPPVTRTPTTCASTLLSLGDCTDFLSIGTSLAGPPATCCGPLRAVLPTPASICLCHTYGSEINEALGINVDPIRLALLPILCFAVIPPQLPIMCFVGPVPPISRPPPPTPMPPTPTPPTPMATLG